MSKFNPFDPANGYSEEDRVALETKCASLINRAYRNPFPGRFASSRWCGQRGHLLCQAAGAHQDQGIRQGVPGVVRPEAVPPDKRYG